MNDFKAQWQRIREDALTVVDRVGASGWLILGQEVAQFETELAKFWDLKHAVGCASGLDAIELGLRVLGIKPGDQVLTTPVSAFPTTLAIYRAGGVPVFVDVDECGLVDLDRVDQACRENPELKFFVPVHLFGFSLDLHKLAALKEKYSLKIVEDCAQAIGASFDGKVVGSVGDIAATSFYPTKNLGCMGDGGAVLTNDAALAEHMKTLRDYGQSSKYHHREIGMNSRLDELQAGLMTACFLPSLAESIHRRQEIAARYRAEITNSKLTIPQAPAGADATYHLFPVFVQGNQAEFQEYLKGKGIESGIHYPIAIPDQEAMKSSPYTALDELKNARYIVNHEVSIPVHPYLKDDEVERVIEACNQWGNTV